MKGRIKSFGRRAGFGFITAETDYFFHIKEWKSYFNPEPDMEVEFKPVKTRKGWKATEVRRLKDGK